MDTRALQTRNRLASKLALPLLAKELTERAARKRTYVIRVLFAIVGMIAFGLSIDAYTSGIQYYAIFGSGIDILRGLILFQLTSLVLFLPAMTAGQVTLEKERDSLSLLFLTRLSPWQIVIEKYLAVLVPIFALLLITMPMAAIAYAYGGVTQQLLWITIYLLALTALQVAAFSLMCSAWCKTTTGAFLLSYLLGILLYLIRPEGSVGILYYDPDDPSFLRCIKLALSGWLPAIQYVFYSNRNGAGLLEQTLPGWISIVLFLGFTRIFLIRRAFVRSKNRLLIFFRSLDVLMQRINRITGNKEVGKGEGGLPGAYPIAWREMRRNVLVRPHYLLRIVVVVELLVIVVAFTQMTYNTELFGLIVLLGALTALVISVNGAGAFVSERVQQTLDLLLTTPLSARRIVQEKARAMHRLLYVAAVPLLTLILMEWGMKGSEYRWNVHPENSALYLVCGILTLAILPVLVLWLSIWAGLKAKTRLEAIGMTLGILCIWCCVPSYLAFLTGWRWLSVFSPLFLSLLDAQSQMNEPGSGWLTVAIGFSFYGAITWFIRWHALRNADRYLRR